MATLVTIAIFTASQITEITLLKAQLRAEGIAFLVIGENPSAQASDIRIQVKKADAEKAFEVVRRLESLRRESEKTDGTAMHPLLRRIDKVLSALLVFWIAVAAFKQFGGNPADWLLKIHFAAGLFLLLILIALGIIQIYGWITRNRE